MGNDLAIKWIKMAAVYLTAGVMLGIHMGKSHDFVLAPVHAHVNLLGWATMALMGALHHLFAQATGQQAGERSVLVAPVGNACVAGVFGHDAVGQYGGGTGGGIASIVVGVSVLLFLVNVLRNLRAST